MRNYYDKININNVYKHLFRKNRTGVIDMLVNQEQLKDVTDYSRPSDITRWLQNHGVKYWTAKNGTLVTTTEAINEALLTKNDSDIEFR